MIHGYLHAVLVDGDTKSPELEKPHVLNKSIKLNGATPTFEELSAQVKPLRQKWIDKFAPLYGPPPPRLPPLRAVNHTILLVNPDVPYSSRPPRCSAALFPLLREKTQHYVQAGWWEPAHGKNAAPLLAIPKTGAELKLCTVINARERNANTIIDATPLPNQDLIREAVVSHKYISIIDISDAYEQLRIVPEDIPKTLFSSPLGTFTSNVRQQRGSKGLAPWQRLMMDVFRERIGVKVRVCLDDIYIYIHELYRT